MRGSSLPVPLDFRNVKQDPKRRCFQGLEEGTYSSARWHILGSKNCSASGASFSPESCLLHSEKPYIKSPWAASDLRSLWNTQPLRNRALAQPNSPASPRDPAGFPSHVPLLSSSPKATCPPTRGWQTALLLSLVWKTMRKAGGSAKKLEPERVWGNECFMAHQSVFGHFLGKDDAAFEKTKFLLLMMEWASARTVKTHHLWDGDILNSFHPGKWFSLGKSRVSALINDF